MQYGLRNVTMDDLCREMGMSKKTLYQHVSDKADLIVKTVQREIDQEEREISGLMQRGLNAIDELLEVTRYVSEKFQQIHPATLFEMQKYYPEAWQIFEKHRSQFVLDTIESNITKGIGNGLYRPDVFPRLIARLYSIKIDLLAENRRDPQLNLSETIIFFETLKYHLRGICSAEGLKYLETKLIQMQSSI